MKRPEKKPEIDNVVPERPTDECVKVWNYCCDKWEKFLPSEEEILTIISSIYSKLGITGVDDYDIAKAIHKRLAKDGGK